MSYEVNILVNGNRCKQYNHNGRLFIEAKKGSEYCIEIKNNNWTRILTVCSVDGLDILNGKPATEDGPGYVINGLNSCKFDGFRVSNEKVAKFVFDYEGASYAKSKEDGSEKNVGVIGVRAFEEKFVAPQIPTVFYEKHHHHHHHDHWPKPNPYIDYPPIWCDSTYTTSCQGLGASSTTNFLGELRCESNNEIKSKGLEGIPNEPIKMMNYVSHLAPSRGFDMGTKWGDAKESKVVEVEFERGNMVFNTNIYYASRESLIEMGVPLGNEKQVSFPEPFTDSKYAKPPKGWRQ